MTNLPNIHQTIWPRFNPNYFLGLIVIYFVCPFFAWLIAIYYANRRSSYFIFFLFSLLLCWHMSPVHEGYYDDFIGIMERFNATSYSTEEIKLRIKSYFSFANDAPKELYEDVLIWFVKLFSNNYHFYFLLASIPVAFFQLGSLKKITQDSRFRAGTWYAIMCVILFIYPRDIITVQNPRFTTGLWLIIYFIINYFTSSSKNIFKLLPIIFAPLIHSGLWPISLVILIYFIIPKKISFLEKIAIITMPFSFLDSNVLQYLNLNELLPSTLYNWSLNYFDPDNNVQIQRSGFWWVSASFYILNKIIYLYMLILLIKNRKDVFNNGEAKSLYPFLLFLTIFINIVQGVPELGKRYFWFYQILIIPLWFKSFYPSRSKTILALFISSLWSMLFRYGYILGGALAVNTPIDVFFMPLPYLMGKGLFW